MWPKGQVEVQLYCSMTAALEGGEWSAARSGRTLHPGKTRYPLYRRLGGPQGRSGRAENLVPTGIRSQTVQPVVSRYTDWATGPTNLIWFWNRLRAVEWINVAQDWDKWRAVVSILRNSFVEQLSGFMSLKKKRSLWPPGLLLNGYRVILG